MKPAVYVFLIWAAGLATAHATPGKLPQSKAIHSPKAEPAAVLVRSEPSRKEPWIRAEFQFSEAERVAIGDYIRHHAAQGGPQRLPSGLAKKLARGGGLPPGCQKKCIVGEVMPAEVYARCSPLPSQLVVNMPSPPEPTITVPVGGKVVRRRCKS